LGSVPTIAPEGAVLMFNGVPVGSITRHRHWAAAPDAQAQQINVTAAIVLCIAPSPS
jgi:hypothetical protein